MPLNKVFAVNAGSTVLGKCTVKHFVNVWQKKNFETKITKTIIFYEQANFVVLSPSRSHSFYNFKYSGPSLWADFKSKMSNIHDRRLIFYSWYKEWNISATNNKENLYRFPSFYAFHHFGPQILKIGIWNQFWNVKKKLRR